MTTTPSSFMRWIATDEDLQDIFTTHEYSGLNSIELYVTLQVETQETHVVQSQVIDPPVNEQDEVDVIDEEEDDLETEFYDMVNEESDDEQQTLVPPAHAYAPPAHMSNLNLQGDEPSSDIFFTPYIQNDEELKEGDKFPSKEACLRRIKNGIW